MFQETNIGTSVFPDSFRFRITFQHSWYGLNIKPSSRVTGEDLRPYVTGERTNRRDHIVTAYGYVASVVTPEWNYSAVWNKEKHQGTYKPQLYDRKKDPHEVERCRGAKSRSGKTTPGETRSGTISRRGGRLQEAALMRSAETPVASLLPGSRLTHLSHPIPFPNEDPEECCCERKP